MFIVVASQQSDAAAYVSEFIREGMPAMGLFSNDCQGWLDDPSHPDLDQVKGFLIEETNERIAFAQTLRKRTPAPLIALSEARSLERTLELLTAGLDDVVRRPVHVKEILARSEAIWRRHRESQPVVSVDRVRVYFDGRSAEVDGIPLDLPRRERNMLEFIVRNRGRALSKDQIFHALYQDCETALSATVVEGHMSKLRKKLRLRLGYDIIVARRHEGYTYLG